MNAIKICVFPVGFLLTLCSGLNQNTSKKCTILAIRINLIVFIIVGVRAGGGGGGGGEENLIRHRTGFN